MLLNLLLLVGFVDGELDYLRPDMNFAVFSFLFVSHHLQAEKSVVADQKLLVVVVFFEVMHDLHERCGCEFQLTV